MVQGRQPDHARRAKAAELRARGLSYPEIGRRLGDNGETAYLEWVKSAAQKEKEREERMAREQAKDKREAGAKKDKEQKGEGGVEKPLRGRRKQVEHSETTGPVRKRTRRGVKTG